MEPGDASVHVGSRRIGGAAPCFVIAEAGVNHNGDVALAKRLVEAAAAAGADAVKFQTWRTEDLAAPGAPLADYQRGSAGGPRSQFELLRGLELDRDAFAHVKARADELGILFFSAADDEASADLLDGLGVELYKVGSGELTNLPLLAHVAAKGRPIVLSTGMGDLGEVEAAVRTLERSGCPGLVLLHCVSAYPAPPGEANLRAMDTLAAAFGRPVGFSDHTLGVEVALAAVARGACALEKHLTLDRSLPGPDQRLSLEPDEFRSLVRAVRVVESALGDGRKRPASSELETRAVVRRVVVAARTLRTGETIGAADLALRRADGGLPPAALELLVGRRTRTDVQAGSPLALEALE